MPPHAIDDEKDTAVDINMVSILVAGPHAAAIARGRGVHAVGPGEHSRVSRHRD
jgi:hypothetical protein